MIFYGHFSWQIHLVAMIETVEFRNSNRNTLKMILNIDFFRRDENKMLEAYIDQNDRSKEEAGNGIESIECVERVGIVEGVQNVEMIDCTKKTEFKVEMRAQAVEIIDII